MGWHIPLWNRSGAVAGYARVDEADVAHVSGRRWRRGGRRDGQRGYAVTGQSPSVVSMHRDILGLALGTPLQTDHINRDTLDNRRCNLRFATHAQNMQNRPSHKGSTSPFRGVYWDRGWRAKVRANGRLVLNSRFRTEQAAADAAAKARRLYHPFSEEARG